MNVGLLAYKKASKEPCFQLVSGMVSEMKQVFLCNQLLSTYVVDATLHIQHMLHQKISEMSLSQSIIASHLRLGLLLAFMVLQLYPSCSWIHKMWSGGGSHFPPYRQQIGPVIAMDFIVMTQ